MRKPIVLTPNEGRRYEMGSMSAIFKADCAETDGAYSISEWWLEPYSKGPGAHSHPEDDVFYVLEGVMSFLIGDELIFQSLEILKPICRALWIGLRRTRWVRLTMLKFTK
jgi:hypothetical protein